jgi:glycolate oxidase FAD binding subunit
MAPAAGAIDHYPGDLVATVPASVTLAEANAHLAHARQWLPLDPPFADRATIGDIVAANDSGPRRHAFGTPRDLILGVEVALADGRAAHAGGRVVKNVAGYDLARLLCGSYGSLAVITRATFKLAPLADTSRTVMIHADSVEAASALALAIAAAPLTPSALEIAAPDARLLVRFETTARVADHMAATVCTMAAKAGCQAERLTAGDERPVWQRHDAAVWDGATLVARVSVLPSEVPRVIGAIGGVEWALAGRAALGVLVVRLDGSVEQQVSALQRLGERASERGGHVTVSNAADDEQRVRLEAAAAHGANAASTEAVARIHRALKARFDPRGVLPHRPGSHGASL